jgi:hypothetical protein
MMARFRVELAQTIIETAIVYIEANNQQEAEELALGGMVGAGVGAPCTVHRAAPAPDQGFLESVFTASVATFVAASPRLFACSPNALNCISINSV